MQRGSFQRFGNCRSHEYGERCNRERYELDTIGKRSEINESKQREESNKCSRSQNNECAKNSKRKAEERRSQNLERNIGLVRGSEENYGDKPCQNNQANARSKNDVDKCSNDKNTYSRNEAHDNNQFRRNVRGDSVSRNTSDMLDRDGNPDEGERDNSEVSNGRENVYSIGVHDQSEDDGQLLVIILFYEESNDCILVLVFQ